MFAELRQYHAYHDVRELRAVSCILCSKTQRSIMHTDVQEVSAVSCIAWCSHWHDNKQTLWRDAKNVLCVRLINTNAWYIAQTKSLPIHSCFTSTTFKHYHIIPFTYLLSYNIQPSSEIHTYNLDVPWGIDLDKCMTRYKQNHRTNVTRAIIASNW